MTPEKMKRLATPEFSAVLAADPVLAELQSSLHDPKDWIPGTLDALLLSGGTRIGSLPVLPLTAAKWAFLWAADNPLVTGRKTQLTEEDLNVFLFVLCCPDLRQLTFPLTNLPVEARDYAAATGLPPERLLPEIRAVVDEAFLPLSMLPHDADPEDAAFYDGAWLAWIGGLAARESNLPYDRVIHELPLSLVCNLFISWHRREGADWNRIRRPANGEIMEQIAARVDELGKEFLEKNADQRKR